MLKSKPVFIVLVLFTWCCVSTTAQVSYSKFDLRTQQRLLRESIPAKFEHLLVFGFEGEVKQAVEKHGGIYKYGYSGIHSVAVPLSEIRVFATENAIQKIESISTTGALLMDTARLRNNVDSIHHGYTPLIDSLTGKGVIIGIIDGGIDWQHEDFTNPATGKTRIRYIWDQSVANGGNKPLPYQYGNQWNWYDIDNFNCTHVAPASDFGHGTCVAGIAAGNGFSMHGTGYEKELRGIAPEADIVAVRILDNNNFLTHVADAVDYIFKKADALGMPCVINTSVGTYYGSHDGRDAATRIIEHLLEEKRGRCLVAAAGNGGHVPHHLTYPITADSSYTFFAFNSATNEVYFDFWADTSNFNDAKFAIGCNDNTGLHIARTNYMRVHDFALIPGQFVTQFLNLYSGNTLLANVGIGITLDEDRYHVEFLISPSNNTHLWRLQTTGSGQFDLWSSSSLHGSANMLDSIGGVYIQYPGYKHPDYLKTMVSSWQCSPKVITVGNYSNRAGYIDRDGVYRDMTAAPYNETVGKRFATSSFGPTRTGLQKPDVIATGSTTICTGDAAYIASATAPSNRLKVYITKKHVRNGGTSMASPIVAGIAALYLQQKPSANYQEIQLAINCTAVADSFTGAVPNFEYGNGKVNGFAALTRSAVCIKYGATDTACINYLPIANVDTGGCIAKVYGCTDTAANNYNSLANVNDGSCDYSVGLSAMSDYSIKAVPNPTRSFITFITADNALYNKAGYLEIWDVTGRTIHCEKFNSVADLRSPLLSAGCYFYRIIINQEHVVSGKFVVQQ